LGGLGIFTFLILSPDFDTWGKYRQEFPQSHYDELKRYANLPQPETLPLPKFRPAPYPTKYPDEDDESPKVFYVTYTKSKLNDDGSIIVNSGHVDPPFRDVDPPAQQAINVRAK
jgi:hypothetical protein